MIKFHHFFEKEKKNVWNWLKKKFQNTLSILGKNKEVSNDLFIMLEEFACQLYGYQNKSTDWVRFQIYDKKYTKQNNVIDMASLPPCSSVLRLHILRSNMVESLWKSSTAASFTMRDILQHSWDLDGSIQCVEDVLGGCGGYAVTWKIWKPWRIFRRKW